MKNLKNMGLLKKISFLVLIIAVIAFFAIPSYIFADEGDVNKFIGIDGASYEVAGQYVMGDNGGVINDADGTTEVFCIDTEHSVNYDETGFGLTGGTVSQELITDGDTQTDAYAAEILSKEATGATSVEDQAAMWILTNNKYDITVDTAAGESINDKEDIDAIDIAARALADEYIAAELLDPNLALDKFLEDTKNVNEIDVTIEQTNSIFTGDAGTATATLAEPFVPTVTDQNKNVYWYILEGSFNISFSPTELILQSFWGDGNAAGNATKMTDSTDDPNDIDKDGKIGSADNFGKSTVNYFYFPWLDKDNNQLYATNTMGVNLFAWVDVDEDAKYDLVDSNPSDGNVLSNYNTVKTELNSINESVIDTDTSGNVETKDLSAVIPTDTHKVEGGSVIKKIASQGTNGMPTSFDNGRQSFSTLSYTEPYDDDPQYFGTLIFKYTGVKTGLPGAQFGIFKNPGDSEPISVITSDSNGFASTGNNGLEYGTYYVKETVAPSGYDLNTTVFTLIVGGNGVGIGSRNEIIDSAPFGIINTPTPPAVPPTPISPASITATGGTVAVAALTEGVQVLAFTGQDPIISIAGLAAVMAGLAMLIVTLSRKYSLKLQKAKK
jgi:hypothetical protein